MDERQRAMRPGALLLIGLMGLVLIVGLFQKMDRLMTNPLSRVITVERLVEADTWAHVTPTDTTPFDLSIDMVKIGDNFYSSKPPNYPLLMAGEAMAMKALTGQNFHEKRVDYLRMLVLLNQILPYMAVLWLAFLFLSRHTADRFVVYFMLAALGVGMLSYGYAATINNHTPTALIYLAAFLMGLRFAEEGRGNVGTALIVGLLCGFALTIELPSGFIAVWLVALLFFKDWKRALWAVPAFILPILLMFYLYDHISGDFRPFYIRSGLYRFEGSYWNDPRGIDAVRPGKLEYFFHMFFGFRGLFSMTPLLLLGVWGFVKHSLGGAHFHRRAFAGITAGILALVVFVVFRTWNYGGACIGMRWFICFSPLLLLMGLPVVEQLARKGWGRALLLGLLVWGMPWVMQAVFEEAFVTGWFDNLWGR